MIGSLAYSLSWVKRQAVWLIKWQSHCRSAMNAALSESALEKNTT
jgi:hypothetical protein